MAMGAGWYPDQVDASLERFWNGEGWTQETRTIVHTDGSDDNTTAEEPTVAKPDGRRRVLFALGALAVLTIIAAVAIPRGQADTPETNTSSTSTETAAAQPKNSTPKLTQAEKDDNFWEGLGYKIAVSGNVYIKAAESGQYTCGRYNCLAYFVHTIQGCPSALYVEASVVNNGVVVGMSNDMVGGIPANGDASVLLEDIGNEGTAFRLTDVNCY